MEELGKQGGEEQPSSPCMPWSKGTSRISNFSILFIFENKISQGFVHKTSLSLRGTYPIKLTIVLNITQVFDNNRYQALYLFLNLYLFMKSSFRGVSGPNLMLSLSLTVNSSNSFSVRIFSAQ